MLTVRVRTLIGLASSLSFLLASCGPTRSVQHATGHVSTTGLPDSVVYRPYRLLLEQLGEADWQDRKAIRTLFRQRGFNSAAADSANRRLQQQDSLRLHSFQVAERRYGWPRATMVGKQAVEEAFLLIQHAPPAVHASYQDSLRASYMRGELYPPNYATYLDRILVYRGQPQRYGTQSGRLGQEEYLLPVEDVAELDHRRATMQLEPILSRLQPGTLILKPTGK